MTVSEDANWNTIQVSNLPLETTRFQLEHLFEDLGPVKKCFVLKPREGKKTTLGYVTFAMHDDCKAALEIKDLNLDGVSLNMKVAPDKKIYNDASKGENIPRNIRDPKNNISKNKARLIIRNLSFKSDDISLKKFFSPHGPVVDVNILKKPDGRMVGCAFVEFKKVEDAGAAIKAANASQFLGRTIAVDWAVPKEVFKENKADVDTTDVTPSKEIEEDPASEQSGDSDDDAEVEGKDTPMEESEDSDDEDESCEEEEETGIHDNEDKVDVRESVKPHNLKTGHDVGEGKTVFIRNLSYDTDQEDLRDLMEEYFGGVVFAKLVMDKEMGHPRGTAFVKFKKREFAEKCVEVGEGDDGVYLDNRKLTIMMAQEKGEVEQKQKEREKKEPKDNRNLYLAREGIIREGTAAAEGVSTSDMTRRKFLDKQKKNMLKNLNNFVSANRLCVRNLPVYIDDGKLKAIFAKAVPKSAKITEAKVMKDMTVPGKVKSKEFGFVTFENHEDALVALRNVNNNPNTFTAERRPIVEFSIENRKALLARQKRMEKSREKNPNYSKNNKSENKKLETKNTNKSNQTEKSEFSGMISDPKQKGLPTHSGPKVRADRKSNKISRKSLKKQELDRKNPKKRKVAEEKLKVLKDDVPAPKQSKKEKRKQKKLSNNAKKEFESEKKFNSLVNQYRSNVKQNDHVVKKWFDS